MKETIVQLREPSIEGRLYYRPTSDHKHNLLLIQNPQLRQMAYCVNIGSVLLLYFDARRKLQDIEFGIHRNYWQKSSSLSEPADMSKSSDIFLLGIKSNSGKWKHHHIWRRHTEDSSIRTYEYECRVIALTNLELSAVQIVIGVPDKSARWISLSEYCWAQIADNRLKGFFIKTAYLLTSIPKTRNDVAAGSTCQDAHPAYLPLAG